MLTPKMAFYKKNKNEKPVHHMTCTIDPKQESGLFQTEIETASPILNNAYNIKARSRSPSP